VVEVVALAGALADAGEHRVAAVRLGDVVDQLHDDYGLADAGAAEQADLAALRIGREQIDDLDAGDQDRRFGGLVGVGRRILMDGPLGFRLDRTSLVDRIADHVDDAAEEAGADRHRDRAAGVAHFLPAHQAFAGVHGNGAHGVLTELLRHFEHQAVALVLGFERIQNRRQLAFEVHVDDGADDLGDTTDSVRHCSVRH
jgi:peptide chain release factor 1